MDTFTTTMRCSRCGAAFPVELSRMRVNFPNSCSACGAECAISGDRAISAHRLLEELEYKNRTAAAQAKDGHSRPLSSLPFPDLPLFDDPWPEAGQPRRTR
ncbi:MAG: hypothetical protein ABSD38_11725 [Syntrophorhabdales bacterium]|jgi:DNA-directed RNA polymerase subunit RPC12/RpoP